MFVSYLYPFSQLFMRLSNEFRKVMVTEITSSITYNRLCDEMRDICNFDEKQPFTMKWVDEEGMSHMPSLQV